MSDATKRLLTDATGQAIAEAIQGLAGGNNYDFSDWRNIVAMIRSGNVNKVPLGVIFKVTHAYFGDIYFITRARNQHKVAGDDARPTVTIQAVYLLSQNGGSSAKTFVYDRPEAFYDVTEDIAAGTVCQFTTIAYGGWTAGTWNFTASEKINAGSKLAISGYESTALGSLKVRVFANAKASTAAAEYAISSGAGSATKNLGTWGTECNHPQRVSYGSNNEPESNLFKWLNSDAATFSDLWTPATKWDLLNPDLGALAGFLAGFPTDFRGALGLCAIPNITNGVFEAPDNGYQINKTISHNGYFFLPSRKEIYGSNENSYEAGETQFAYYANVGTGNADKLMFAKGASSPTTYWLRTPYAGNANNVRICHAGSGGALNDYHAIYANGAAPLAILA